MDEKWITLMLFAVPSICGAAYLQGQYGGYQNPNGIVNQYYAQNSANEWPWLHEHQLHQQSPVDILTNKAQQMNFNSNLEVFGVLDGTSTTLKNNGHGFSVVLNNPQTSGPKLSGSFLTDEYIFENLHFHWGSDDYMGSEHFINGESRPFEAHMVTYKRTYGNLKEAVNHKDGVVVLTFFGKIAENDNTDFQAVIDLLPNVSRPESTYNVQGSFPLSWFWSEVKKNNMYYAYHGSLTTPDFQECVTFVILPEPISISSAQLQSLRRIFVDTHGKAVTTNRRELHPLIHRKIIMSGGITWNANQRQAIPQYQQNQYY